MKKSTKKNFSREKNTTLKKKKKKKKKSQKKKLLVFKNTRWEDCHTQFDACE